MSKYMYLTDPTLPNKVTLFKDRGIEDELIKTIIEKGILADSLEQLTSKIDLIEVNGSRLSKANIMLLKKDLVTYYKRVELLKTVGTELDNNELRNYMELIINSPYIEEDITVLKQHMIRIVRKNSKYALDLFWKTPKELTLTLDRMIEEDLENVINTNPEALSVDVEELLKRIKYCKDNGISYYNAEREATESYIVSPLDFVKRFPNANTNTITLEDNNDKIVGLLGTNEFFNTLVQALDTYYAQEKLAELPVTEDIRMIIDNFENKFNVDKVSNNAYSLQGLLISKKKIERNLAVLINTVVEHEQSISNIEKEIILIAILHNLKVSEETMRNLVNSTMGFNQSVGGQAL